MPRNSPSHKIMVIIFYSSQLLLHRRQGYIGVGNPDRRSVHWFHSKQNLGKWNSLEICNSNAMQIKSQKLALTTGSVISVAGKPMWQHMILAEVWGSNMTKNFTSLVLLNAFSFAFIFNVTSENLELYLLPCWCCWYIAWTQEEKTHSNLFLFK